MSQIAARMCDKWGYGVNRSSQIAARMCDTKWGYVANRMSQIAVRMKILRQEEEKEGAKKFILMTTNTVKHTATYSEDFPYTFLHVPHCPAHNFFPIPLWPHFPDAPLTSLAHPHSQPP